MADYVVAPPPSMKAIAVTRNTDVMFTLRRKDAATGAEKDWGALVYVLIDVARNEPPVRVDADVSGADAVVRIESDICDVVKTGTPWRAVLSLPTDPSLEKPIAVGFFERHDGGTKP